MIFEYAVDPGVVHDWQVFRHIADGLGFGRGRVLVQYPKHWLKLAYQIGETLDDDNAKKKIVTWLRDRANRVMTAPRKGAQPFNLPTWLESAVAEHARMPFHAIIADKPTSENPPVLNYSEVEESTPSWAANTQHHISRSVGEVVKRAAPLLAHASSIRFIDPYFTGDDDQVAIVVGSLSECVYKGKTTVASIELHVDGGKVQPPTEVRLLTQLNNRWPVGLPPIKVVRWRPGYIHNRFILTDRGGIIFGDSLRQHPSRPDQMTLLEDAVRTQWWNDHDATMHPTKVCKPGETV